MAAVLLFGVRALRPPPVAAAADATDVGVLGFRFARGVAPGNFLVDSPLLVALLLVEDE